MTSSTHRPLEHRSRDRRLTHHRTLAMMLVVPGVLAAAAMLPAAATAATVSPSAATGSGSATIFAQIAHPGLDQLLVTGTPNNRAIITFTATPTNSQVSALRALGLVVQPMKSLPLALVEGPIRAISGAISLGIGLDAYPDESIELLDTESSNSMSTSPEAAAALRASGLTGAGVTVGVIDSGCDATQPDLAGRVTHNVKLFSPEYVNLGTTPTIIVPVDMGPHSNSDIGGGHGTHVAGIIAADSSSMPDGSHLGVAPDAELACFSIGEVLFTTAVVTAYDYILTQPDMLGIDIINNSWGNSFRQFDPADPVAVATKAVFDRGVIVVFAAGNSGGNDVQASLNPFSQSPWVISVAAGSIDRLRAGFSSNGYQNDNSEPVAIGADGQTTFLGDRIGLVHPDLTAPGLDINSTCTTTGSAIGGCLPGENRAASGTSMASPAIAGAAAVLLQAQPLLTPDEIRLALQASATAVASGDTINPELSFWQVGYGYVNLDSAVALVEGEDYAESLQEAVATADLRVLEADGEAVLRSDIFSSAAPTFTAAGSTTRRFTLAVGAGVEQLQITLAHPSGGTVGLAGFQYTVTVFDPSGTVIATAVSDPDAGSGTAALRVDLAGANTAGGEYRFEVIGDYAASDPDTLDSDSVLGRSITLQVAQLVLNRIAD